MSLQFIEAKNQSWRREEKKKNSNLKAAETDNLFRSMYLMQLTNKTLKSRLPLDGLHLIMDQWGSL